MRQQTERRLAVLEQAVTAPAIPNFSRTELEALSDDQLDRLIVVLDHACGPKRSRQIEALSDDQLEQYIELADQGLWQQAEAVLTRGQDGRARGGSV